MKRTHSFGFTLACAGVLVLALAAPALTQQQSGNSGSSDSAYGTTGTSDTSTYGSTGGGSSGSGSR